MNTTWKIAGVQMDCRLGDKLNNLQAIRARLKEAAGRGARLIVFPECALTGYCFDSKAEAMEVAEPIPGPSTVDLTLTCQELRVWVVYGLLERDGDRLFNACVLLGPEGLVASYRKVHLPHLGVDRFTTPGDRPFAVHDISGLKVGMNICYDGGFPESARVLALQGADLIVLPTNWPPKALPSAQHLPTMRALENTVYYAAVNRVGTERGFDFIGLSQIVAPNGEMLAASTGAKEEILTADIDPAKARQKHLVLVPGKHEINRLADRRPELYGPIVARPEVGA
jgi:predicted amidohydrolase